MIYNLKSIKMSALERYLDTIGERGSMQRLEVIASMNLGQRSESAKLVMEKRNRRIELMQLGHSYETAVLIVNIEYPRNLN